MYTAMICLGSKELFLGFVTPLLKVRNGTIKISGELLHQICTKVNLKHSFNRDVSSIFQTTRLGFVEGTPQKDPRFHFLMICCLTSVKLFLVLEFLYFWVCKGSGVKVSVNAFYKIRWKRYIFVESAELIFFYKW